MKLLVFLITMIFLTVCVKVSSQEKLLQNHFDFGKNKNSREIYNEINLYNKTNSSKEVSFRSQKLFKLDSIITFLKKENTNEIHPKYKSEYILEELSPKEILLISDRNQDNTKWNTSSYAVFYFNKKDLIERQTFNNYDLELDEKDPEFIRWYIYDEDGLLIRYEDADRNEIMIGELKNSVDYFYNEQGLLKSISRYFWYETRDSTYHTYETIYRHNEQNKLKEIVNWRFDFNNGWTYSDSTYLRYDSEGRITSELKYVWIDGKLKPTNRIIYDYHMYDIFFGDLDAIREWRSFNEEDQEWRSGTIQLFQYNPDVSIKDLTFRYLGNNDVWTDQYRYIDYDYSELIQTKDLLAPRHFTIEGSTDFALLEKNEFNGLSNSIVDFYLRDVFHYSDIETSSLDILDAENIEVFPNPFLDNINIPPIPSSQPYSIDIYNVSGVTVFSLKNVYQNEIDLSELSSGLYFYNITIDKKISVGKLVKS